MWYRYGMERDDATERAWRELRGRLAGFVRRQVPNESDVEDIVQNVFVRVHARLDTLRSGDRIESWLYAIARNEIAEHFRRRGKAVADALPLSDEMASSVADEDPDSPAARNAAGAEEAERTIRSCLLPMVTDLPGVSREALLLTEYEGLTQREVADRLGISLSGAKSRVQRAREKLKDVLLGCCHLEFDRTGRVIDYKPRADDCRYCDPDGAEK